MKYLLPCDNCGKTHTIDTTQAGQQIRCPCGSLLEVPSLGGIRRLQPASEPAAPAARRKWNRGKGLVFAAGMFLAGCAAAVAGLAGLYRVGIQIPQPPVYDAKTADAEVDGWSPSRTWDEWNRLREAGLGPYHEPPHHFAQRVSRNLTTGIIVASCVMAFGLAVAAAACAFPGTKPEAAQRRG